MAEGPHHGWVRRARGRPRYRRPASLLCAWLCAWFSVSLLAPRTRAADPSHGTQQGNPVGSVFFISKSENRNQVHYAVQVDAQCQPKGKKPLYGYWRDFEVGPRATSPLLAREQSAYGLTDPRWVKSNGSGGEIRIGLRGFPDRPLTVQTFQTAAGCRANALTTIGKTAAALRSIYVEIGFLFSIDYVIVRGLRVQDGRPIQEKVSD
jgi:hypothetical protein